jgi:hypothetical protein
MAAAHVLGVTEHLRGEIASLEASAGGEGGLSEGRAATSAA